MTEPSTPRDPSGTGTYHDSLTAAERYRRRHEEFWHSAVFEVEWSGASIIAGLEIPIVGGMVDRAVDYAIGLTVAMMGHPDADLRWIDDLALVLRGKIIAIVRLTSRGPEVARFDTILPLPIERVVPGRRASRQCSIILIDASLDSTCYGLGVPLNGRGLAEALDHAIRSLTEATEHHDPTDPNLDDVALSYRGRILALVRFTPGGPIVMRFDLPGPSAGIVACSAAEPAQPTQPPSGDGSKRLGQSKAIRSAIPWPREADQRTRRHQIPRPGSREEADRR